MFLFRPIVLPDLRVIYDLQNIPFRDQVYANVLPDFARFEKEETEKLEKGEVKYFLLLRQEEEKAEGFVQYLYAPEAVNAIIWGKWLNTMMYAGLKTAFDTLNLSALRWGIRENNKRMLHACKKFGIRKTGQEMLFFRKGGFFGTISTANFHYYEMTAEEFREKASEFKKQSHPIRFLT